MTATAGWSMPDEALNYWADRFVESGLADAIAFADFIQLTPPLRERRLLARLQMALRTERLVSHYPRATVRNGALVDPFRTPGPRPRRRPWFSRLRS